MVRLPLVTAAVALAAAAPAAAVPPPPGEIPPPPEPTVRPETGRTALQLLHGRLEGRRVTLTLACGRSGRLELTAAGRRLGTARFACRDSRARIRLALPASVARRGQRVTATAHVGGWRTSFALELGRRVQRARAAYDNGWTVQAAWCTNYGFQASIDTATRLGAAYGEQVWWRPVGWQHETQSWSTTTYLAGHGLGSNLWDSYKVVPDHDYLYDPATRSMTFYGNAQVRSLGLWTTRTGVWVAPAIQSWTQRGGFQHRYVRTTATNGYGEELSDWCYVPTR